MEENKNGKSAVRENRNRISKKEIGKSFLFEAAWEVCNQVGGIYTVVQTKVPTIIERWGRENYCLLGPYAQDKVSAIFEPIENANDPMGRVVSKMRAQGYDVHYGTWLVAGRPRAVLFNPYSIFHRLGEIKYELWEHHGISTANGDSLLDAVVSFGYQMKIFFQILCAEGVLSKKDIIAHFHEWMAGTTIPAIRRDNLPVHTVFTTHATLLGRYLAMNDPLFYEYLPFYDWEKEAKHFNIEASVKIERAAAHGSHVFTTVSEVTARECINLLGREPDVILPNGINIERFEALHEFQNLHLAYKMKIHEFVMGHFFQSYSFDLDKTLYFFTSGRYEYRNKGFDLMIEALARLNWKLKQANSDVNIVFFFITKRPFHSVNPDVLHSRAVMEEVRSTCEKITRQVGDRLFYNVTAGKDNRLPQLNDFVDDSMRLMLRRTLTSWRTQRLPSIVTHNLIDDHKDEILNFLRSANLVNNRDDKVKVVYHPDFISATNPLFGIDYGQFVRGCHLGVFPSYYEPWGYTPLECVASGVPTITSDLSGFGDYVLQSMKDHKDRGIYVAKRRHGSFEHSASDLADIMFQFTKLKRRERIAHRNKVESSSVFFDWEQLASYYEQAYKIALQR